MAEPAQAHELVTDEPTGPITRAREPIPVLAVVHWAPGAGEGPLPVDALALAWTPTQGLVQVGWLGGPVEVGAGRRHSPRAPARHIGRRRRPPTDPQRPRRRAGPRPRARQEPRRRGRRPSRPARSRDRAGAGGGAVAATAARGRGQDARPSRVAMRVPLKQPGPLRHRGTHRALHPALERAGRQCGSRPRPWCATLPGGSPRCSRVTPRQRPFRRRGPATRDQFAHGGDPFVGVRRGASRVGPAVLGQGRAEDGGHRLPTSAPRYGWG
jgi:hypothetical protein